MSSLLIYWIGEVVMKQSIGVGVIVAFKLKLKSGEEKGVEIGAVIWVKFENWKEQ